MEILDKKVSEATEKKFAEEMEKPVTLVHFSQEPSRLVLPDHLKGQECMFCRETKALLTEVSGLSEKISLEIYDFTADTQKAEGFKVDKIPATTITADEDYGIRIFGIPSGYEFTSLIEAITDVSRGRTSLSSATLETLKKNKKKIHLQVFVTPTCPYCTVAVRLAHQMALVSELITADMVEATEFPHLSQKYGVQGVPRTVVNDTFFIDGAVPEPQFLEKILEAVEPGKSDG
jgi:glutaredoxin-like protein